MKVFFPALIGLFFTVCIQAQFSGGGEAHPELPTHQRALEAFREMRFGLFIHWGPVSLRGEEISWSRGREIPTEEYDNLYKKFNPELFNAAEWVGAAKAAGMKYLIITSRHHDGFSLWDSRYTAYDMAGTPYGKGVLKALSEECRKQGIKFGTYYSICDWYRSDYPVTHPYPDGDVRKARTMDPGTEAKMDRYIAFMKNQLRELIEDYHSFLIWFDGEWEWPWTHDMGMDLYAYVRGLKDDILINNRVDKGRAGMEDKNRDPRFAGDFATPEQQVGAFDNQYAWESCMTIGTQWAWKPDDNLRSKRECLHTLAYTVGGDGNLLFNVGPMPDGRIEPRQVDRLREMGEWMAVNGEAVYGTRGGPYLPTGNMVSTHSGNKIYLYLLNHPGKALKLPLDEKIAVKKAYFMQNERPLKVARSEGTMSVALPGSLPDEDVTVVVLELDRPASEIDLINI